VKRVRIVSQNEVTALRRTLVKRKVSNMGNKLQIKQDKAHFENSSLAEALKKALPEINKSVDVHEGKRPLRSRFRFF
jgi:hypothetical protein